MAIRIQSPVLGNGKPISTMGGFTGPTDWTAFADFCNERYFVGYDGSMRPVDSSKLLAVRQTGFPLGEQNTKAGELSCESTSPTVGLYPPSGRRGLIIERKRTNLMVEFDEPSVRPRSKHILAAYARGDKRLRVIIRPGLELLRGKGTKCDPLLLSHDGARIDFCYTGHLGDICVEELADGSSPSIAEPSGCLQPRDEFIEFLPPRGLLSGTTVFHFIEHSSALPDIKEARSLFSLNFDGVSLHCIRFRKENWLDVAPDNGRSLRFQLPQLENTIAVSWCGGASALSVNGLFKELAFKPPSAIKNLYLGSRVENRAFPLGGIVPSVVCFDRALSSDELTTASQSWR